VPRSAYVDEYCIYSVRGGGLIEIEVVDEPNERYANSRIIINNIYIIGFL